MKKVIHPPVNQRPYYIVDDVMKILNVARIKAYEVMREVNDSEQAKGHIVIRGRVSKKAFDEMCSL